ncbi:flavin reductase family protein [Actinoplanes sp. NPDC051861]|uniref:flavin reductase family protein n=1 Tax=Actinoplanes sp. NPDC051861 TaxID=3155170 RepID=UPI003425FB32
MISDIDIGLGERFKTAFRRYPTGVAIISAAGPVGLTASSVASVSVEPAALSFSVMGSPSARAVTEAPGLVVNLLGPGHTRLAHDFSRPGSPRFTPEQGWEFLPTGEPFLPGALACLLCVPLHLVPVGGSTVVVAEVRQVRLGDQRKGHLVYHDRRFVERT